MGKRVLTLVAAAAAIMLPAGASADPGTATHVDSVSAGVSGNLIAISGTATFVDSPKTVVGDVSGDAFAAGYGADITTGTISRNPTSGALTFTFNIADQPQTLNGSPAIVYQWPIAVNGEDKQMYLQAGRVNGQALGNTNPGFFLLQDGADGFSIRATLTGTIADGKVTITMTNSQATGNGIGLKALPGTTISQGGAGLGVMGSTAGLAGRVFLNSNAAGDGVFMENEYVVPGPTVELGMATAGTAPGSVPLNGTATVNASNGSFSGSLPRPAASGDYVVVAKACYGADSCALSSVNITI